VYCAVGAAVFLKTERARPGRQSAKEILGRRQILVPIAIVGLTRIAAPRIITASFDPPGFP